MLRILKSRSVTFTVYLVSAVSWAITVAVGQFFKKNPLDVLSGPRADGWCDVQTQSVFGHCFSDYAMMFSIDTSAPWSIQFPHSHPPMSQVVQSAFVWMAGFVDYYMLLFSWLTLLAIAVVWSSLSLLRRINHPSPLVLAPIALSLTPVVMSIDRGNSTPLLLVALAIFLKFFLENSTRKSTFWLALLANFRPQALGLALSFLPRQSRRLLIRLGLWGLGILSFFFAIYPGDRLRNISDWFSNISQYSLYANPFAYDNWNLGIGRTIVYLVEIPANFIVPITTDSSHEALGVFGLALTWVSQNRSLLVLPILALSLILALSAIACRRALKKQIERIGRERLLLAGLIVMMIGPATSFGYYGVLAIPILLLSVGAGAFRDQLSTVQVRIVVISSLLTLIPLWIPVSLVRAPGYWENASLLQELSGPSWLVALVVMLFSRKSSLVQPGS